MHKINKANRNLENMLAQSHFVPPQAYVSFSQLFQNKLFVSKRIIKDAYFKLLCAGTEIIDILDKDKISFEVSLTELNSILEMGGYSKGEQAYIRRMRHQGRNNVAAKRLRIKKRREESKEEESLQSLETEKQNLLLEMRQLQSEIEFYKSQTEIYFQ